MGKISLINILGLVSLILGKAFQVQKKLWNFKIISQLRLILKNKNKFKTANDKIHIFK